MTRTTGKTLVAVKDVHKKFLHEGHEVLILKGIDLVIEEGEMLAVVGASGAGKSTLLHILGTLDLPTSGVLEYGGEDVTRYSASRLADFRNRSLGFVFQFHHLLPEFTALENVMMPGMIRGTAKDKLRERAIELLGDVGLSHRMSHRPGELSGGEQQRVALARALVMDPKLVLADEPTGNLDSKTSEAIHRLFIELNQTRGTTFLVVTHSRDLAERMPRKVSMQDGKIVQDVRREPSEGPFRRTDAPDPETLSEEYRDERNYEDEDEEDEAREAQGADDEGAEAGDREDAGEPDGDDGSADDGDDEGSTEDAPTTRGGA